MNYLFDIIQHTLIAFGIGFIVFIILTIIDNYLIKKITKIAEKTAWEQSDIDRSYFKAINKSIWDKIKEMEKK